MITKPDKNAARLKRHIRVRAKISGTPECPRLDVFRSAKHIYAQIIDDTNGVTLCAASSMDKDFEGFGGNKEAAKKGIVVNVLLEVNMAKEDTKFGLMPEEVMDFIHEIVRFQHIKVQGLMTIAPFVENPEENRIHFANLRKLSVDIAKEKVDNVNMSILSMGMTNDFEVAIEEGATMVRIGTAIFGERNYAHQI